MINIIVLIIIMVFFAARYAYTTIDPDMGMFTFEATTGSWYGRDYADCKSPLVHVLFWLISKVVGKNLIPIRFVYHLIVGSFGLIYYAMSGNFWGALAYMVMVNSGWLLGFHGNVSQIPAGLILVSFASGPWLAVSLWVLAALYNPKVIFAMAVWVVANGYYIPALAWIGIGAVSASAMWYFKGEWFDWIYESTIDIPKKMNDLRKGAYGWMPSFAAIGFLYLTPFTLAAIQATPDWVYWLAPLVYILTLSLGHVIRPNHLIPLVPWVAAAIPQTWALALALTDFISGGVYLGDIWLRFYPGIAEFNRMAMKIGLILRDEIGTLWVNGMYNQIHSYSQKPIIYGCEQIEIRDVIPDRRKAMGIKVRENKPMWIVNTPGRAMGFNLSGYTKVMDERGFQVYRLEG